MNIKEQIAKIKAQGYDQIHAEARLCQDIIIQALAKSTLNQNVIIKGGVVMRSISKDARRATRDLDIDFIRYSLEDSYIDLFIQENNLEDIVRRVTKTFENSSYRRKLETTETNWLGVESAKVLDGILDFLKEFIN